MLGYEFVHDRDLLLGELRCTLEATADGILVTDLNGRVRAFNQRFAEMWAMPPALLQARDDAGVMDWMTRSVVDAKGYEHRLQALREAALVTACDRIELHSGQVLDRVTRPLFQGGSPRGRVYSFRDLTERMAAQERIDYHLGGVWFVSLVPVDAAAGVAPAIAAALHVPLTGAENPVPQLVNYLRDRDALLILDDFEHVLAPASLDLLTRLLGGAPQLRIVVTSRARLQLRAEHVLEIGGLPLSLLHISEPTRPY